MKTNKNFDSLFKVKDDLKGSKRSKKNYKSTIE